MPLYEYECNSCGHRFEKLVSISLGSNKQTCPSCGKEDSEKLMSAFSTKSSSSTSSAPSKGGGGFT